MTVPNQGINQIVFLLLMIVVLSLLTLNIFLWLLPRLILSCHYIHQYNNLSSSSAIISINYYYQLLVSIFLVIILDKGTNLKTCWDNWLLSGPGFLHVWFGVLTMLTLQKRCVYVWRGSGGRSVETSIY